MINRPVSNTLRWLLILMLVCTVINIPLTLFFVIFLPFGSFLAYKTFFYAFLTHQPYLLGFIPTLCLLTALSLHSIKKEKILFPLLLLAYFSVDLLSIIENCIGVHFMIADYLLFGIQALTVLILMFFLGYYSYIQIKQRKTGGGSLS